MLDAAVADMRGGETTTGVRWWIKYCVFGRSRSPFTHLNARSPHELKVEAEQMLMDFCIWLATCRPSGRSVSAKSIRKYLGQIRAWHRRKFHCDIMGDLDAAQLKDTLRAIVRTVRQPAPVRRWGVRTQHLAEAVQRFLRSGSTEDAMWEAALTIGFTGLFRGAELALQQGQRHNPDVNLTRADAKVVTLSNGQRVLVVQMRPAKRLGATKTVPVVLGGGGSLLDPVIAYERMVELDPVPKEKEASTPLFRRANGLAIKVAELRGVIKLLMSGLGLPAARFGAHSLRIGGATAALAAGMSPAAIRAAGRWASDIYILYTRSSREAAVSVAKVIGSTPFTDLERGVEFCDEELMLTSEEMPYGMVNDFVDRELLDDALADEDED